MNEFFINAINVSRCKLTAADDLKKTTYFLPDKNDLITKLNNTLTTQQQRITWEAENLNSGIRGSDTIGAFGNGSNSQTVLNQLRNVDHFSFLSNLLTLQFIFTIPRPEGHPPRCCGVINDWNWCKSFLKITFTRAIVSNSIYSCVRKYCLRQIYRSCRTTQMTRSKISFATEGKQKDTLCRLSAAWLQPTELGCHFERMLVMTSLLQRAT